MWDLIVSVPDHCLSFLLCLLLCPEMFAPGRWFSKLTLIFIRIFPTCHNRPLLVGSGLDKIIMFIVLSSNCFK